MKRIIGGLAALSSVIVLAMTPLAAHAASTVVVTQAHDDGWSTADTRPGGNVQFVYDPSSPAPDGALQLSTDSTNAAKAQYMHTANTALSNVTNLAYATRQVTASSTSGDPSYQLVVCLAGVTNNTCNGATTLVYEPYWNGTVSSSGWQTWKDVASGKFWSSTAYSDTTNTGCSVQAGAGGAPFYSLSDLATSCPAAQVVGFGVNIGTYNPGYVTEVDNVVFNDWTYDFQLTNAPTNKDQCKDKGFETLTDQDGNAFKNQGNCVAYSNAAKHMSLTAHNAHDHNGNTLYDQVKDNGSRNNANLQTNSQTQ